MAVEELYEVESDTKGIRACIVTGENDPELVDKSLEEGPDVTAFGFDPQNSSSKVVTSSFQPTIGLHKFMYHTVASSDLGIEKDLCMANNFSGDALVVTTIIVDKVKASVIMIHEDNVSRLGFELWKWPKRKKIVGGGNAVGYAARNFFKNGMDDGNIAAVWRKEKAATLEQDDVIKHKVLRTGLEHDAAIASDIGYSRSGGHLGDDSVMLHYNATYVVDQTFNKPQRDQNTHLSMANFSHKLVNTSSNINTWKSRAVSDIDNQKFVQETELNGDNYDPRVIKDNNNLVTVSNGNRVPTIHAQREIQKTLPSAGANSTGRPIDDADSRTIFISNVHFATTIDSLSWHFNKFGVVIVTEVATG
ncbi:Nucleotide-binding, alpha-beta plait [Artemisia annua]|uniref:Nucleotide-binding, alpha-beta plait n=1 Tax=Artemisia annua TaxID=35608 RepID=A0A2U1NGJ2_ARTAN|nr:Nucleotide-binding, alpha-beta plait [Artemisia annua]